MTLLDYLLGRTGYDPLTLLFSGLNILQNATFCIILQYTPIIKFLRVKVRTAVLLNLGLTVLSAAFFLCFPDLLFESEKGQIVGLFHYLFMYIPLALFLFRDCFFQNLFMIAFAQCGTQFVIGLGNWFDYRYGDLLSPDINYELSFLSKLFLIPLFLPIAFYFLRKLFAAWSDANGKYTSKSQSFWKALWLIPTTFCILTAVSGTIYNLTDENSIFFLLSRIFSITALVICIDLMTDIMNRERKMAAARMKMDIMTTADKALEKSQTDTLTALEKMKNARLETVSAINQIIAFAKSGSHAEIYRLLSERMAQLDTHSLERVCENEAVNALVVYYVTLARNEGIDVSYRLVIPGKCGRIQSVDLSRIIGNMLENAIEACRRMEYGAKKIRLQSMITGDMLVFGMNNSFDGDFQTREDGGFISRKRDSGIATGLSSIKSVAEKYDGSVKFEAKDRTFSTSVRLDMTGQRGSPRGAGTDLQRCHEVRS
jgi:hypothetical protein